LRSFRNIKSERMCHEVPGMRGVYSHDSDAMRAELKAALEERWAASLRERARLAPGSIVPVLDALLAEQGGSPDKIGYCRAREGHAARPSMRTMGACQVGTTTAASGRCLRSCMPAVVRPCCCTTCCTDLTRNCRSSSVRLPQATLSALHWPVWHRVPPNR
jgi:hypothetical protein